MTKADEAQQIMQACVVTAEVMGHELTPAAAEMMARELSTHDMGGVLLALSRCHRELSGRLSLAKILERIPGAHMGADEAWAICPTSEDQTVVWTVPMARAFGACRSLLEAGDKIAARMAFKDAYAREVAAEAGQTAVWSISMGHEKRGREGPILEAVALGRLTEGEVRHRLPESTVFSGADYERVAALTAGIGNGISKG